MSSGDYFGKFLTKANEKNILSWSIEYNEHKNYYESVEQYYGERQFEFDFIDYDTCKKTNTVYCLRWYPKTPIGFYAIYGSDINEVLKSGLEVLNDK